MQKRFIAVIPQSLVVKRSIISCDWFLEQSIVVASRQLVKGNRVCFRRDVVQCLSCDNLKYKRATKGKCAVLFINSSKKNANQIPDFAAIDV